MITAAAFVAAAIAGALTRAEAGRRWNRHNGFAVGTLIVNVTGSFMLGLLSDVAPTTMTVVGVGGLGAYTTFSSFARDTVALAELRRLTTAALLRRGNVRAGPGRAQSEWRSPTPDKMASAGCADGVDVGRASACSGRSPRAMHKSIG